MGYTEHGMTKLIITPAVSFVPHGYWQWLRAWGCNLFINDREQQ
ncbi:hypothetical protein Hneap_0966 [Halothiobacillus neapolitanus c2]|uniref:Uncharacterized protein n=1 Tax=Halothiobacillus neapolitanus (strain ATCC 23641 / DSM 15147 / CIP 104769 / NCIMB 8539 / c2) TaxID=555778 RepID=D0KZD1_HALNC|nr:hypothetical protein Hneap_0966 [Halothiobacillus neapolitanus c2]